MGSLSCKLWQALHLRRRAGIRIVTQTCQCLQCAAPICFRPRNCPALHLELPSYMQSQPTCYQYRARQFASQINIKPAIRHAIIAVNTCNAIPVSLVDTVYSLITSKGGQMPKDARPDARSPGGRCAINVTSCNIRHQFRRIKATK